ncbi:MAG: hypothetical protein ABIG93_04215 [archaeon]|nr:hypothetical protein [Nanoarchaeota archaeon]
MARRKSKQTHDNKTGTYLTVMVACVAIVALVVLVLNSGGNDTAVTDTEVESEDAALAGQGTFVPKEFNDPVIDEATKKKIFFETFYETLKEQTSTSIFKAAVPTGYENEELLYVIDENSQIKAVITADGFYDPINGKEINFETDIWVD